MDYVIREAAEADAGLLASLIREAFADVAVRFGLTPENSPTHPSNCTPEWIRSAFAKGIRHFVLETPEGPAGCVALEQANADVCYLERLAVLPAYRRNGFGEALVNYAVDRGAGARRASRRARNGRRSDGAARMVREAGVLRDRHRSIRGHAI